MNGDSFIFKALILGFLDLYTMPDWLEESTVLSLPAKNIKRSHEKRQNVVFVECSQRRKLSWASTHSLCPLVKLSPEAVVLETFREENVLPFSL
jgi:hypothetical protein